MVENIRSITMGIEIDTNKQTVSEHRTFDSTRDMIPQLRDWLTIYGFPHDPDSPEEQPERYLTGVRTFARRIGACPRCRRSVEAILTVEVKVDLNEMYWNDRGERPSVGASSKIIKTETLHQCGDEEDEEC